MVQALTYGSSTERQIVVSAAMRMPLVYSQMNGHRQAVQHLPHVASDAL